MPIVQEVDEHVQLLTTKETELTEAIERLEAEGEVAQRHVYDEFFWWCPSCHNLVPNNS